MIIDYNEQNVQINSLPVKHLITEEAVTIRHMFQNENAEIEAPEYSVKLNNISGEAATAIQSATPAELRHLANGVQLFHGTTVADTKYDADNMMFNMRFSGLDSDLIRMLDGIPGRGLTRDLWPPQSVSRTVRTNFANTGTLVIDLPVTCWRVNDVLLAIQNVVRSMDTRFASFTITTPLPFDLFVFETVPGTFTTRFPAEWTATDFLFELLKLINGAMYLNPSTLTLVIIPKMSLLNGAIYDLSLRADSFDETDEASPGIIIGWKSVGESEAPPSHHRTFGNTRGGVVFQEPPGWATALDGEARLGHYNHRDAASVLLDLDRPWIDTATGIVGVPTNFVFSIPATPRTFGTQMRFVGTGSNYLFPFSLTALAPVYYGFEFPSTPLKRIKVDHVLRKDPAILDQWPLGFKRVRALGRTFLVDHVELNFANELLTLEGKTC